MSAQDWRARAACRGYRADVFITETTDSKRGGELIDPVAARLCASCDVAGECLDYALHHTVVGVWAGTVTSERVHLRRLHGITPTPITFTDPSPDQEAIA